MTFKLAECPVLHVGRPDQLSYLPTIEEVGTEPTNFELYVCKKKLLKEHINHFRSYVVIRLYDKV